MPRHPAALPPALGAAFSCAEALDAGATRGRLRALDLHAPFTGMRTRAHAGHSDAAMTGDELWLPIPGEPARPEHAFGAKSVHPNALWAAGQRRSAAAYLPIMRPGQFFAGRTAAALLRLPVPRGASNDIEVGVFTRSTPPRRRGVRGRRYDERLAEVVVVAGVPVLSPASVWLAVGPDLGLWDRVALGDQVVRVPRIPGGRRSAPRPAYASAEHLAAYLERPSRRRRGPLREALPLLRTGAASPSESHLRLALAEDPDLPAPELDYDVRTASGRLLGCSELVWRDFRLACEYEGDHHRTDRAQWQRDIQKYEDYESEGWGVIRVTADLLYRHTPKLRARVRNALCARGWKP